jgi:pimeloyl-ACP methyl ester carboxylesterase
MRRPDGLNVTVWGEGEPAVLVHGSFGWGEETWQAQRPLADDHKLMLLDRRGYGGSPAEGRADFERDAEDIVGLLASPAHLVGHSYGGVATLIAAARRPDAVRSLTVIEPPAIGLLKGDPLAEDFIADMGTAARESNDAEEYRARFLQTFGFPAPKDLLEGQALAAALTSWHERPPDEADIPLDILSRATFPKLVVRGAWDKAPRSAQERAGLLFGRICDILESTLGAESALFPGVAHNPQLLGEPFNDRLGAFWARRL